MTQQSEESAPRDREDHFKAIFRAFESKRSDDSDEDPQLEDTYAMYLARRALAHEVIARKALVDEVMAGVAVAAELARKAAADAEKKKEAQESSWLALVSRVNAMERATPDGGLTR